MLVQLLTRMGLCKHVAVADVDALAVMVLEVVIAVGSVGVIAEGSVEAIAEDSAGVIGVHREAVSGVANEAVSYQLIFEFKHIFIFSLTINSEYIHGDADDCVMHRLSWQAVSRSCGERRSGQLERSSRR